MSAQHSLMLDVPIWREINFSIADQIHKWSRFQNNIEICTDISGDKLLKSNWASVSSFTPTTRQIFIICMCVMPSTYNIYVKNQISLVQMESSLDIFYLPWVNIWHVARIILAHSITIESNLHHLSFPKLKVTIRSSWCPHHQFRLISISNEKKKSHLNHNGIHLLISSFLRRRRGNWLKLNN